MMRGGMMETSQPVGFPGQARHARKDDDGASQDVADIEGSGRSLYAGQQEKAADQLMLTRWG